MKQRTNISFAWYNLKIWKSFFRAVEYFLTGIFWISTNVWIFVNSTVLHWIFTTLTLSEFGTMALKNVKYQLKGSWLEYWASKHLNLSYTGRMCFHCRKVQSNVLLVIIFRNIDMKLILKHAYAIFIWPLLEQWGCAARFKDADIQKMCWMETQYW